MKKLLFNLLVIVMVAVSQQKADAAQVAYWFYGHVTGVNNNSNALPFSVTPGMPFSGRFSYDPLQGDGDVDSFPTGDTGTYYFTEVAGFSLVLHIAGHTITNRVDPGVWTGAIGLYDQYNDEDHYWISAGKRLSIDGQPFMPPPYQSSVSLYLSDWSKTALNSVEIPTAPPILELFKENREFLWGAYLDDGIPSQLFAVFGEITHITSETQPALTCLRLSPGSVQLKWPAPFAGFILQSTTDLASGNWQNVSEPVVDANGEHTVTVSFSPSLPSFFRLKKP